MLGDLAEDWEIHVPGESPLHSWELAGAIEVVLAASPKYRQPITSRLAHQYVNDLRRAAGETGASDREGEGAGEALGVPGPERPSG
jgi:hypothetical protein